jgi:hypothetical protein
MVWGIVEREIPSRHQLAQHLAVDLDPQPGLVGQRYEAAVNVDRLFQ